MHLSLRAAAVSAVFALSLPAQAALTATGLDCNNSGVMTSGFEPDAIACSGVWAGNDSEQMADVLAQAQTDFGSFVVGATWSLAGKSDDADFGPFTGNPDGSTGTLTFDTAMTGFFAISLKASDAFSLYLFDGGAEGITSIEYSTLGVSLNANDMPQGLSHATLLVTNPVPEPETYALMLAGLGLVGFMARRRRQG